MAIGTYVNSPEEQYAKFGEQESLTSQNIGNVGADLADPFRYQRPQYQTNLSDLMKNPGNVTTSPYYKFLMDEALNQVQARSAASGLRGSGRRLAALSDRAQGTASQAFFPLAELYSRLSGVYSSSPSTASRAYTGGQERAQDYRAMRDASRYGAPSGGGGQPWWMNPSIFSDPYFKSGGGGGSGGSFLPTGGGGNYSIPNTYTPNGSMSNLYQDTIGADPFGTDAAPEDPYAYGYNPFGTDYMAPYEDYGMGDFGGYGDYGSSSGYEDFGAWDYGFAA